MLQVNSGDKRGENKCCKTGESRTKIFRFLEDVSAKVVTESGMLLIRYAVKRERKKEKM